MRRRSSICWSSASRVFLASVMSRAILEAPTIAPDGALIGEMLSETWHRAAVLAQSHGLVILDRFAAADPAQHVAHLGPQFGRHDDIDVPAHGFRRAEPEQPFGGRIPAGDRAVERFGDDGVVGGFDRGAEQMLARGVVVAGGFGAAMFAGLRARARWSWLLASPITRAKARASTPVSPIASTGIAAGPLRPAPSTAAVNCTIGRVSDRATSTASTAAHNTAIRPTSTEVFWIAAAGRHEHGVGDGLDHRDPFIAGQDGGGQRDAAGTSALIRHDPRNAFASRRARRRRTGSRVASRSACPACEPNSRARSG